MTIDKGRLVAGLREVGIGLISTHTAISAGATNSGTYVATTADHDYRYVCPDDDTYIMTWTANPAAGLDISASGTLVPQRHIVVFHSQAALVVQALNQATNVRFSLFNLGTHS